MAACVVDHTVMIFDRGGTRRLWQLYGVASVQWSRIRDDTSAATISILGKACSSQSDVLNKIESSRHELVIFRGNDRVWEGPIRQVQSTRDRFEIYAHDVKEYLDYTALSVDWDAPESQTVLMGDRVEEIIDHELTQSYVMSLNGGVTASVSRWENLDPPINVLPHLDVRPGSIYTTAGTNAFQMTVGEYLDDRADGGLDYTAIGRKLVIWDSAFALGQTRTLTDADFKGDIILTQVGSAHASIGHVSASREEEGEEQRVGHAGDVDDYYGAWETISSQQSEEGADGPSQLALNSQAQRLLTHNTPVPLEMSVPDGLQLLSGLTINDLVPGVLMPVTAQLNIRPVTQYQILDEVTVTEDEGGESISVKLSPWGDIEGAP